MDYKEWARRYMCKWKTNPSYVLDELIKSIQFSLPFSYTRFCDGELALLKEYFKLIKNDSYYINLCNADNHIDKFNLFPLPELNTLGYYARKFQSEIIDDYFNNRWCVKSNSDKIHIIKTIGECIISGLQNSSYIGIWDIEKDVLHGTPDDFYVWLHSYVPHIELFAECGVNFKNITSASIHREDSIANPLNFKEILNGQPIHIFTSNEYELRNVTKLHELLETEITYTNITPIRGKYESFSFMHHDFLHEECKKINAHVILYGLGYGAKHLPAYLSNNYGKTAIDMGAILDGWAGKITRPYMKDKSYMVPNLDTTNQLWIP
jgi:hypothetical protein